MIHEHLQGHKILGHDIRSSHFSQELLFSNIHVRSCYLCAPLQIVGVFMGLGLKSRKPRALLPSFFNQSPKMYISIKT